MTVQLLMAMNDGSQRAFPVPQGVTVIGRARRSNIRIPLPTIEPKHCEVIREGGRLQLRDLKSTLGTLHNGRSVKQADLAHGDRVEIGPITFLVEADGKPAPSSALIAEIKPTPKQRSSRQGPDPVKKARRPESSPPVRGGEVD